uniref:Uncharacterized protein n=1 Tax=Tetranychus urticae TaxID=32264 RepID=T1KLN1_TETUR
MLSRVETHQDTHRLQVIFNCQTCPLGKPFLPFSFQ